MSSIGWRIMRAGSGAGAVLCLNFTVAPMRAQAGFVDLASQLSDGYAVWGTDEGAWPTAPGLPRTQLDEWLDRAGAVDAPVRAVFGFCGTAALAAVLAGRLAGGSAPAVVLFDPIVVGPQNMIDQAKDSLRQLAATTPVGAASDLDEALPTGEVDDGELADGELDDGELGDRELGDAELGELATGLARHYAAHAEAVGAARSIRAATVTQLCRRVEAYLRYLALCTTAWSYPRVTPDLLVLSRDYGVPAELSDVPVVRLDVTEHQLLAHPEAARAAAQVLAGGLVEVDG